MGLPRIVLEKLIFGGVGERRFTQDSPVLPDVWVYFGKDPDSSLELLMTPHRRASAGRVSVALRERLGTGRGHNISYIPSSVAAKLCFDEMVRCVVSMTSWWEKRVWRTCSTDLILAEERLASELAEGLLALIRERERPKRYVPFQGSGPRSAPRLAPDFLWMLRIIGWIDWARKNEVQVPADLVEENVEAWMREKGPGLKEQVERALLIFGSPLPEPPEGPESRIWQINRNRAARFAVRSSRLAIKADAAHELFKVSCRGLAWAVIDGGIDATHHAFRLRAPGSNPPQPFPDAFERKDGSGGTKWINRTRVEATYDFTIVRTLLNPSNLEIRKLRKLLPELAHRLAAQDDRAKRLKEQLIDLRKRLQRGREIDWGMLEPFLRVPHQLPRDSAERDGSGHRWYWIPPTDHGTHVGGILAADWERTEGGQGSDDESNDSSIQGICPDLRLYDLRVLPEGKGRDEDEFNVIAALQFIRWLNTQKSHMVIQGVNLSLSIPHEVANFACGRTPICEECERAVSSGLVVVAAAGNNGFLRYRTAEGEQEGYHTISITDPGNAEGVITVGATHRNRPHTYGVSYFSSRGPTGDGRIKPDLVAPGEKIVAPVPGDDLREKDGTSMAAPHVSGAAALLMARYNELIGQPTRIKRILCSTATDLGRERYFQGHGMLDILRALQSI